MLTFQKGRLRTKKNPQEKHYAFSEHPRFNEEKGKIQADDSVQQGCLQILHVDDDISFLKVSQTILELENGFKVETATSVDEAFCKLKTQAYDAVICDYRMPIKNGLDFLKELREQKNYVAFIIFTGKGTEEAVIRALNLGADYYVDKNGSPEAVYCELADAVRMTVARRKKRAR